MRLFVVDAFTKQPFSGNPAAVCLLGDERPDDDWLQRFAAEMNLTATAFLFGSAPNAELRWFSAAAELELCGHGTLATSHLLWELGATAHELTYVTRSGSLTAQRVDDGAVRLNFPAAPVDPAPEAGEAVTTALGVSPVAVSLGMDLLVELPTPADVQALVPDLTAVAGLPGRGLIATAAGGEGCDFVSRFFAPAVGIPEDSVTGSAHCALGPYWAARLGDSTLTGRQISARGGTVGVDVRGDRVHLTGHAVTVTSGEAVVARR